jgi:hypothetical protein
MKDNKLNSGQRTASTNCGYLKLMVEKCLYVNQLGKKTWPFKYYKLEELHKKFHNGEITLLSHEIDKLAPTWGNYVAGLLKYLGCDKV